MGWEVFFLVVVAVLDVVAAPIEEGGPGASEPRSEPEGSPAPPVRSVHPTPQVTFKGNQVRSNCLHALYMPSHCSL